MVFCMVVLKSEVGVFDFVFGVGVRFVGEDLEFVMCCLLVGWEGRYLL